MKRAALLAVALCGCDGPVGVLEAVPRALVDVTDAWGIAADHGLVLGGTYALPEIAGTGCAKYGPHAHFSAPM